MKSLKFLPLLLWWAIMACAQTVFADTLGQYPELSQGNNPTSISSDTNNGTNSAVQTQPYSFTNDTNPNSDTYRYGESSLRHGWNFDAHIGAGTFMGAPLGCGHITSKIQPSFRAHLGKWFTPSVGSRLSWECSTIKAADMSRQRYQAFHMDILWNLAPMISDKDNFTLAPYFGTGCVWNQTIGHAPMALSYGVTASVKVTNRLSAVLELGALSTFKYFDGVTCSGNPPICDYLYPRLGDNIINLSIGLSYTIPSGKKSCNKNGPSYNGGREVYHNYGYCNPDSRNPRMDNNQSDSNATPTQTERNTLPDNPVTSEDWTETRTADRLYTTEELLALAEMSNQAKKAEEERKAEKARENQNMTISSPKENLETEAGTASSSPTEEPLNAYDTLSKLLNNSHPTAELGDSTTSDSSVSSDCSVEEIKSDPTAHEGSNKNTVTEDPTGLGIEDNSERVIGSTTEKEPTLSPYKEPEVAEDLNDEEKGNNGSMSETGSYAITSEPSSSEASPNLPKSINPEDTIPANLPGNELEDNELKREGLEDVGSDKAFVCPCSGTSECKCPRDTVPNVYGERILLSPEHAKMLGDIIQELNQINQDDPLEPREEFRIDPDWDPIMNENGRLRLVVESYWDLSERLLEIIRLGKDTSDNKEDCYLWVDESPKDDEDEDDEDDGNDSIDPYGIEGKKQNKVVTEDAFGNEIPAESTQEEVYGKYYQGKNNAAATNSDPEATTGNTQTNKSAQPQNENTSSLTSSATDSVSNQNEDKGTTEDNNDKPVVTPKKKHIQATFNIIYFKDRKR